MNRYEVKFDVKDGKIPLVKLVKWLTGMGLKESKDYVEAQFDNFEFPRTVVMIVTEQQLGRYLVRELTFAQHDQYRLVSTKQIERDYILDLTRCEAL